VYSSSICYILCISHSYVNRASWPHKLGRRTKRRKTSKYLLRNLKPNKHLLPYCAVIAFVTGARLYFTVTTFGQASMGGVFRDRFSGAMYSAAGRFYPNALTMVHVRLPPGYTVGVQHRPCNVHSAFYQHGRTLHCSLLPVIVIIFPLVNMFLGSLEVRCTKLGTNHQSVQKGRHLYNALSHILQLQWNCVSQTLSMYSLGCSLHTHGLWPAAPLSM